MAKRRFEVADRDAAMKAGYEPSQKDHVFHKTTVEVNNRTREQRGPQLGERTKDFILLGQLTMGAQRERHPPEPARHPVG